MQPDYTYKAKIINVVDGDTVDAQIDVGFKITMVHRLRLLGVNTPETNAKDINERNAGLVAESYTDSMLRGKDVIIKTKKADAFGRYLATIYLCNKDGVWEDFNKTLIDRGFAEVYK